MSKSPIAAQAAESGQPWRETRTTHAALTHDAGHTRRGATQTKQAGITLSAKADSDNPTLSGPLGMAVVAALTAPKAGDPTTLGEKPTAPELDRINSSQEDDGDQRIHEAQASLVAIDNSPLGDSGGQMMNVPHATRAAAELSADEAGDRAGISMAPKGALPGRNNEIGGHGPNGVHQKQAPGLNTNAAQAAESALNGKDAPAVLGALHNTEVDGHTGGASLLNQAADLRFSDPLIGEIVQLHRMRRRWIKARNALILQSKAFGRALNAGDKKLGTDAFNRLAKGEMAHGDETLAIALTPFLPAIERFDAEIKPISRRLEKLAKGLPIYEWADEIPGLGLGSVAAIVGEAGDLSKYPSVAGVWKRLGLAVIDGDGRQRRVADAEMALVHGYSPERRSIMWNVGNGLIGGMGHGKRPEAGEAIEDRDDWSLYERLFVQRLRIEAEHNPDHRRDNTKEGRESYSAHAAARAKRYVEKRFLRDMTIAWRGAAGQIASGTQSMVAGRAEIMEAAE